MRVTADLVVRLDFLFGERVESDFSPLAQSTNVKAVKDSAIANWSMHTKRPPPFTQHALAADGLYQGISYTIA